MKRILCLHHTDLDGAGSAAVVGLYHQNDQITYRMFNYGWDLKPEELSGYDIIYAVDISFNQDHPWVYGYPNLVWIDHHKTSIEYQENHPELKSIPGIRRIGVGACELTWEYLFPEYACPPIIELMSTYDVWDKTRMDWDYVVAVETGLKHELGISPKAIIDFILEGRDLSEIQVIGKTILGYIEKSGKGKLLGGGFWIPDFYGHRVMALCTTDFSSLSFISYYRPDIVDVCMAFEVIPVNNSIPGDFFVRVSFYTENPSIDVSLLAQKYGGGGHRGAAGCQISLDTLKEILSKGSSLKEYFRSIGYKGVEPRYYKNN